jgi:hypothetical protein
MDKNGLNKNGYQPVIVRAQDGYQPSASTVVKGEQATVSIPVVTPPKGGSGETVLKKD